MSFHQISYLDLKNFGAETVRIGDLNGDGAPDLLWVQSRYLTREISCLTATTIHGEILWQQGRPDQANTALYSDLPVQIYDWDGDGSNEVLWIEQANYAVPILASGGHRERAERYEGCARLHILNANNGERKGAIDLPAPADDTLLFADLSGSGRRRDFVVKDRYWNMWGVSHEGEVMWHWNGSTGHCPAIADVDNDGRDEVFAGYALIDHDGQVLFEHDAGDCHQDATFAAQLPDGEWRLFFGNGGVHCLDIHGAELWHVPLEEAQHVLVAPFQGNSQQVAVLDRGQPLYPEKYRPGGCYPATLLLYDMNGQELWRREQPEGSWAASVVDVRWQRPEQPTILVHGRGAGQPAAVVNGEGEIIEELPLPAAAASTMSVYPDSTGYAARADLWGDSREEILALQRKPGQALRQRRSPTTGNPSTTIRCIRGCDAMHVWQ